MEKNESSSRTTLTLTAPNKVYVEALGSHNELNLSETINTLIRTARKLAELGVCDKIIIPNEATGEHQTYILPLELVDPTLPPDGVSAHTSECS